MSIKVPASTWFRYARSLGLALIVVAVIVGWILARDWFTVLYPPKSQFRNMIAALRMARSGYPFLVLAMPPVLLLLVVATVMGRRRRSWRRWLARGIAASLALAMALAVAEGVAAVRLAAMRVPIPRLHERFPDPVDDRVVDIVILGASSACGVPYDDRLSVGEIVAWKLRKAVADRTFVVTNLAKHSLKLDEVHLQLRALERRPDLVILYSGHNEFSMRHDWSHGAPHYLDEISPEPPTITERVGTHSSVCQVIDATIGLLLRASPPTRTVARRLVDVPVYTAEEYAERLHDFQVRVEAITAYCERVGARVVLLIPPGNDADFEPNRSFLPPETPRAEREAFAGDFEAARDLEATDPERAEASYRALLERQPGFAETHYRLAKLAEQAGRFDEADRHYIKARDCDGLPLRCPSDFQRAYHEVAARHPRSILIDGPAVFRARSPRHTAGDLFFTDGFHPTLIGYTLLAGAILENLQTRRVFGLDASVTDGLIPDPAAVARRFGMTSEHWRGIAEFCSWFYGFTADIRFDPTARQAKEKRYHQAALLIKAGTAPEDVGIPGIGTRCEVPIATDG